MTERNRFYEAINHNCVAVAMTGSFSYDGEGKLTAITYPLGGAC